MKSLRSAVVLLAFGAAVLAQTSIQMRVRLTQQDGSPLRLKKTEAIQIHVQVMDESGGTPKEGIPNEDGELNFSVRATWQTRTGLTPVVYRLRVVSSDYEEAMVYNVVPAQGDRIVTIALKSKGDSNNPQMKAASGSMVSLGRLRVPQKAAKQLDHGNEALQKNDLAKAGESFRKAIELYPGYDQAYNNLGVVLMQQGDVEGARRNWQKAVALNEHFARAYANLGRLALQEKKYADADSFLRNSLQNDPENPEALFSAAEAEAVIGHFDDAAARVRLLHTLPHEKYALAHYVAAQALQLQNKAAAAIVEYKLFLKEAPDSPQAAHARQAMTTLAAKMQQPAQISPPK
jgi:Tfp pilus assembly protein PilF